MRAVLLVILSALLLVACRPTPSDPVQYLHREDSIIIQVLSIDADSPKLDRALAVPEFTLYGDGTLIYKSVDADGTRLLETKLPEDAVQQLLEDIVDEGFLDFLYDQPAPVSATSLTTFVYVQTRDLANAVSFRSAADPQEDTDKEYRSVLQIVATLRSLDPVALTGGESTAYVAEQYVRVNQPLDESSEPSEQIFDAAEITVIFAPKGVLKVTLEDFAVPIVTNTEGRPPQKIAFAPLLPYYENFPEFDLQ